MGRNIWKGVGSRICHRDERFDGVAYGMAIRNEFHEEKHKGAKTPIIWSRSRCVLVYPYWNGSSRSHRISRRIEQKYPHKSLVRGVRLFARSRPKVIYGEETAILDIWLREPNVLNQTRFAYAQFIHRRWWNSAAYLGFNHITLLRRWLAAGISVHYTVNILRGRIRVS